MICCCGAGTVGGGKVCTDSCSAPGLADSLEQLALVPKVALVAPTLSVQSVLMVNAGILTTGLLECLGGCCS